MDDLTNYFSAQDEIETLKGEVASLKKQLITRTKALSRNKIAFAKFRAKHGKKIPTRGDKANDLIRAKLSGELSITYDEIALKCFLSVRTIHKYKLRIKNK